MNAQYWSGMADVFDVTSTACQVSAHSDSEDLCHPLACQTWYGSYTLFNSSLEPLGVTRIVFVNVVLHVASQKEVQRVEVWGMVRPDVLWSLSWGRLPCLVSVRESVFDVHFVWIKFHFLPSDPKHSSVQKTNLLWALARGSPWTFNDGLSHLLTVIFWTPSLLSIGFLDIVNSAFFLEILDIVNNTVLAGCIPHCEVFVIKLLNFDHGFHLQVLRCCFIVVLCVT